MIFVVFTLALVCFPCFYHSTVTQNVVVPSRIVSFLSLWVTTEVIDVICHHARNFITRPPLAACESRQA